MTVPDGDAGTPGRRRDADGNEWVRDPAGEWHLARKQVPRGRAIGYAVLILAAVWIVALVVMALLRK